MDKDDGQPINTSVLYDQDEHISSAVWNREERDPLICNEHTTLVKSWVLTSQQIKLVEKAGFGHLRLIPATYLDAPLISALVERWRSETNTFHMSVGEMTVTLEDVAYLLGLSIDGEPVRDVNDTPSDALYRNYLGRVPPPGSRNGAAVSLKWLKDEFGKCPEQGREEIEFHTRAYLLYLVGSTIFSNNTGIHPMYLPLFGDFEKAGNYAWGAAALSFLYRALGNASLISKTNVNGCLSLLQCWSYYHLNIGRPKIQVDPTNKSFPLVVRWKNRTKLRAPRLTSKHDHLCFYRKALDSLTLKDVSWRPYAHIQREDLPEIINTQLESGLGRSRTMLICFHIAEWHLPDRCTRQFGMSLRIPKDVERQATTSKKRGRGQDSDDKMKSDQVEKWRERHSLIVKAEEENVVDENEYMNWYFTITRRWISPQNISATDQPQSSDAIF